MGLFSQLPRCIQPIIHVGNDYPPSLGRQPIQVAPAMRLGEYFGATHINHPRLVVLRLDLSFQSRMIGPDT